jgi:uncharacterized protein (TIGR02145 family)
MKSKIGLLLFIAGLQANGWSQVSSDEVIPTECEFYTEITGSVYAKTPQADAAYLSRFDEETQTMCYADKSGKILIGNLNCSVAHPFVEGFALLERHDGTRIWIDKNGLPLLPPCAFEQKRLTANLFAYKTPSSNGQFLFWDVREKREVNGQTGIVSVDAVRPDSASPKVALLMGFTFYPAYYPEESYMYDEYGEVMYDPETGEPISAVSRYEEIKYFLYNENLQRISNIEVYFDYESFAYNCVYESQQSNARDGVEFTDGDGYLIDENGNYIYDENGDLIYAYSEDNVKVVCKSDKYMNSVLIPEGIQWVGNGIRFRNSQGLIGSVDLTGKVVQPFDYILMRPDTMGMFQVKKEGKYGWVDVKGKTVIPPGFDDAYPFDEYGTAIVVVEGKTGLINRKGLFIVPADYVEISRSSFGVLVCAKTVSSDMDEQFTGYGLIAPDGRIITPPLYGSHPYFNDEGKAITTLNGLYGVIDTTGKVFIPFQYQSLSAQYDGYYNAVNADGKHGKLTKEGKVFIPFEYDQFNDYFFGPDKRYLFARKDKYWGLINRNGEVLIPFEYDWMEHFNNESDKFFAKKNDKMGMLNDRGELIVPIQYEKIRALPGSDNYVVSNGKDIQYYSITGEKITPEIFVEGDEVKDVEGNTYKSVKVGDYQMMRSNLKTRKFNNGDDIQQAQSRDAWKKACEKGEPAWCYYEISAGKFDENIVIYNAAAIIDERGIAPEGWYVPSEGDFESIAAYYRQYTADDREGLLLRSAEGWTRVEVSNLRSGMDLSPSGMRWDNGLFSHRGFMGGWWTSSTDYYDYYGSEGYDVLRVAYIEFNSETLGTSGQRYNTGFCVRCVKSNY